MKVSAPALTPQKIPGYASLPACSLGLRPIDQNQSPPNLRRSVPKSGSYKFVFRRDCTLEAMRTQGAFSLFQDVATRFALWHWPLQSHDDLFGDLKSRAAFSIYRLAKMGIVVRFNAFDYSTRDPLRPRPFNINPTFHKALFYGRRTCFQTKHPQLGVKRLDS